MSDRRGLARLAGGHFVLWISSLAVLSVASFVAARLTDESTAAIPGFLGFSVVAAGLIAWASGHHMRHEIVTCRASKADVWPVAIQIDDGKLFRRGYIELGESGVSVATRKARVFVEWSAIEGVTDREGGVLAAGRVLLTVPGEGIVNLDFLRSNLVESVDAPEFETRAATLREMWSSRSAATNRAD